MVKRTITIIHSANGTLFFFPNHSVVGDSNIFIYFPLWSFSVDRKGSLFWCSMQKIHSLIAKNLAWRPGKGDQILIVSDPIIGVNESELFPETIIYFLNNTGFRFLKQIFQPEFGSLWTVGWLSAQTYNCRKLLFLSGTYAWPDLTGLVFL